MVLNKKFFLSVAAISIFSSQAAFADSSVYFDDQTGTYGYYYGAKSVKIASEKALFFCKDYGGKNCKELIKTAQKGYGAIAEGKTKKGSPVIGAVLGYPTQAQANKAAIGYCNGSGGLNAKVTQKFYDGN
jgi:hypothetical protein